MTIPQFETDAPEYTTNVPQTLGGNGKELEQAMMDFAVREKGRLFMGRYGTKGTMVPRDGGGLEWKPVSSMPDFDLTFMGGATANIEAKVCSGNSFKLDESHLKDVQYEWLRNKAIYGVPCFLVIHFNRRYIGKSNVFTPAFTISLFVHPDLPLWQGYENKTIKSISRETALALGTLIPWTVPKGCRKALPHFI